MIHGNKKYFFEKLQNVGDSMLAEPNKNGKKVNSYSLTNQIKKYLKESNQQFDTKFTEHRSGSITVTRTS